MVYKNEAFCDCDKCEKKINPRGGKSQYECINIE